MAIIYPENVVKIAEILKKSGFKAYAVGGCMRDSLMGRIPADWDMTTDCSPEKMLEIFENKGIRTIPTGLKHGTVTLLLDGVAYECTTFRIDGSYTDSRHPDEVLFTNDISLDLCRRDFTVNAIAGDPMTDEIVDLYGGKEDIERKIIRAVGDAETRFTEDALRILRALRFATVLDFEIEKNTLSAAKKLGERLSGVSAERKSVELEKILLSKNADRGISLLLETETAKYIHPGIKAPKVSLSTLPDRFSTRLASIFEGAQSLSCMKLSGEITKQTKLLCDSNLYRETVEYFTNVEARARLMLSKYGDLAPDAALLRGEKTLAGEIILQSKKSPAVSISDLAIGGNDLLQVGIEPRKLGEIMKKLLLSVIEHPEKNEKRALVSLSLEMV
jgi:tRNA nucleotidyltransferase (CCA-adding enzyme)